MSTHLFRMEGVETDDGGDLQTLDALGYASEELVGVHRVMPFGLSSHAPVGSHSLGIASRGERTLVAALGLEHPQYRQRNLKQGQTVLYDQSGNATRLLGDDGIWHDAGTRPQKATGKTLTYTSTGTAVFGSSDGKTYIGGDPSKGGSFSPVMTQDGPSTTVYAKL